MLPCLKELILEVAVDIFENAYTEQQTSNQLETNYKGSSKDWISFILLLRNLETLGHFHEKWNHRHKIQNE